MQIYEEISKIDEVTGEMQQWLQNSAVKYEELKQQDPLGAEKLFKDAELVYGKLNEARAEQTRLRDRLADNLKTGKYLTEGFQDPMADTDLSEEGIKRKTAKALSTYMGQPVDVTSGIDLRTRAGTALLQGETEDKYLAEKFGEENVRTINVSGKPLRIVRENDQWKAVNEMGFSFGDLAAGAAYGLKEGTTLGASIGGYVIGKAIPGVGTVGGPILSASLYTAVGTGLDQAGQAILGAGEAWSETLGRRSTEAMLGLGVEAGIGVAAKPFLKRMGPRKLDREITQIEEAEKLLRGRGIQTDVTSLVQGGGAKSQRLLRVAEDRPDGWVAKTVNDAKERLDIIRTSNMPSGEKAEAAYKMTLGRIREDQQRTVDYIKLYNDEAGRILEKNINEQTTRLAYGAKQDIHELGKEVFGKVRESRGIADDIKNQTYNPFYQRNNPKVSADPIDVANTIETEYFSSSIRSPQIDAQIAALRERPENARRIARMRKVLAKNPTPQIAEKFNREISRLEQLAGPLNAKQLDDQVALFREAVPEGGPVGQTRKVGAAARASKTIESYRNGIYEELGIMDEWQYARSVLRQRLGFDEGNIGKILKETIGDSAMDETQIVANILSSPRKIQDTLTALSLGDPAVAGNLRMRMQNAYLQQIGVARGNGMSPDSFNFDEDVVRALYGFTKKGEPYSANGDAMVKKLYGLQETIATRKLDPSKLTIDDIQGLSGVMSENNVKEMYGVIGKRIQSQMELEEFTSNTLMDMALKGHREVISSGEFPKAILKSNVDNVGKLLSKMPPAEQKVLRGDVIEHFFAQYPNKGSNADVLWDGASVLRDFAKTPKKEKILRRVVGDDLVDEIKAASVLMQVINQGPTSAAGKPGWGVYSKAGLKAGGSLGYLLHGANNYYLSATYRAGQLSPFLRSIANKKITEDQYRQNVDKVMGKLIMTSKGIEALTQSGRYDAEWSAWLGGKLGVLNNEAQAYQEEYGVEK
jgi:hypothetical protein